MSQRANEIRLVDFEKYPKNKVRLFKTAMIRNMLRKRYASLGLSTTFASYISKEDATHAYRNWLMGNNAAATWHEENAHKWGPGSSGAQSSSTVSYDPPEPEPEHKTEPKQPKPQPAPESSVPSLGALDSIIEAKVKSLVDAAVQNFDVEGIKDEIKTAAKDAVDEARSSIKIVRIEAPNVNVKIDCQGQHKQYSKVAQLLTAKHSVWLYGPAGWGKTTVFEQLAPKLGLDLYIQGPVPNSWDVLGHSDANGTVHDTEFSRWVRSDKPAMVLLDEVDGYGHPAQLACNLALANGYCVLPDGKKQLNSQNVFCGTANTLGLGPDGEYVGRIINDGAFRSRFLHRIFWGPDLSFESDLASAKVNALTNDGGRRAQAKIMVERIQQVRQWLDDEGIRNAMITPRQVYAAAECIAVGISESIIWEATVFGSVTAETISKAKQKFSFIKIEG